MGLTVNGEYIACGSETNEVFVYHKVIIYFFVAKKLKDCFLVSNSELTLLMDFYACRLYLDRQRGIDSVQI